MEEVTLAVADVKVLLDIVSSGMNFGANGIWEIKDAVIVRRVAEAIGKDPLSVTPNKMMKLFTHAYERRHLLNSAERCMWCDQHSSATIHIVAE